MQHALAGGAVRAGCFFGSGAGAAGESKARDGEGNNEDRFHDVCNGDV